jgi:starch synthase
MKVAIIAPEVFPFSKTGGLADVVGALPGAFSGFGAEVITISPLYRSARNHGLERLPNLLTVPFGSEKAFGAVCRSGNFHFIEHDLFFDRAGLYGDEQGDYGDNAARFVFLCRGALEFLCQMERPPDVIHVHDWQAGLVPLYVKTLYAAAFPATSTVFTLHNLAYQGRFQPSDMALTGLDGSHFNWRELEHHGSLNFMKAGLVHADAITTVSPTYAREIRTPEHGHGLDGVVSERAGRLHGILNGVDYAEWSPERDPNIEQVYSSNSLEGKAACKAALQRRCGLPVRPDAPLLAMVGRLVAQKGLDIFLDSAIALMREDVQIVLLGTGEKRYEEEVIAFGRRFADKVSVTIAFDDAFAHQIQAGSDMLLVPSRYEPCGLTQIHALRYGTVPVVRATGGLADTVEQGVTGFAFDHATSGALQGAVRQALVAYGDRGRWTRIMRAGMEKEFSWDASAREYLRLFRSLVGR